MYESPLFWPAHMKSGTLLVLDETKVPNQITYIPVNNVRNVVTVIKSMKTRAFGQFLVVLNAFLLELDTKKDLVTHLELVAKELNESRPTFPFAEVTSIIVGAAKGAQAKGLDVKTTVGKTVNGFLAGIRGRRLERVAHLAKCFENGDIILTHCNVSGELAMAASLAKAEGRFIKVYATETRPYLQGAKLTVWELQQAKIPVTLVPDNAIGSLLAEHRVNKVVIGSDRNAANGDIANKIGSYQIAVLAQEFGVPLIVLTQPSKGVKSGMDMPIEQRDPNEILNFNKRKVFGDKVQAFYPGFDVVPAKLITKGIPIHAGL